MTNEQKEREYHLQEVLRSAIRTEQNHDGPPSKFGFLFDFKLSKDWIATFEGLGYTVSPFRRGRKWGTRINKIIVGGVNYEALLMKFMKLLIESSKEKDIFPRETRELLKLGVTRPLHLADDVTVLTNVMLEKVGWTPQDAGDLWRVERKVREILKLPTQYDA